MDDVPFSYADIQALADKLSKIKLNDDERKLLVSIFAAAAARAKPGGPHGPGEPVHPPTLPEFVIRTAPPPEGKIDVSDLKYQLLNAFIPGQDFTWVTLDRSSMEKVISQPAFPPPPPPPPKGSK